MPRPEELDDNFETEADVASINEAGAETTAREAAGNGGADSNDVIALRTERDNLYDRLARAQADFQNSRKRLEAEADQRLQYANANLIKSLLPVIDNLERAIAVDLKKTDAAAIIKGLQVLADQFVKVLTAQHVETIAPDPGTPFDPTKHEALLQQPSEQHEPNTVTQVLQKGYMLRDRTLRPAQVAVAK